MRFIAAILVLGGVLTMSINAQAELKVRTDMLVSSEWLAAHMRDQNLVILCVAGDAAFYERHIPGARFIPWNRLVTQGETLNALPTVEQLQKLFEEAGITRHSRIVLYGDLQGLRAARAYFTLDYVGLADHAALLDGGLERWTAEKRELSSDTPHIALSKLDLHANPKVVVTLDEMKRYASDRNAAIFDSRPTAEFTGEKTSEAVPRAGHIPGAQGVYWVDLIRSKEDPVLKSPAELQDIFAAHGASRQQPVVSYCRTGVQASFDYFVAKYLGYESKNYVSSFYEWSRKETPVETSD